MLLTKNISNVDFNYFIYIYFNIGSNTFDCEIKIYKYNS